MTTGHGFLFGFCHYRQSPSRFSSAAQALALRSYTRAHLFYSHLIDDPHKEQLPRPAGDGEQEGPVQHKVNLVLLQRRRLIRLDHGVGHPLTALLVDSHPGGVGGLGDIGVYPLPQHGGEVGQGGVEHIGDPQRLQPADQVGLGGHVELGQGQVYL